MWSDVGGQVSDIKRMVRGSRLDQGAAHDVGRGTLVEEFVAHEIHVGCHVVEVAAVVLTEVVLGVEETILGTAAVAGEEPLATPTAGGEGIALAATEGELTGAVHEGGNGRGVDVAEEEVGEDVVVAAVEVAVVLQGGGMAAGLGHGTDTGSLVHPAGKGGVEELDEDFADIVAHPLVEEGADEMGVLAGKYGVGGEGGA